MKDSKASPSDIAWYSVLRACSRTWSGFCGTFAAPVTFLATAPLTESVTTSGRQSISKTLKVSARLTAGPSGLKTLSWVSPCW